MRRFNQVEDYEIPAQELGPADHAFLMVKVWARLGLVSLRPVDSPNPKPSRETLRIFSNLLNASPSELKQISDSWLMLDTLVDPVSIEKSKINDQLALDFGPPPPEEDPIAWKSSEASTAADPSSLAQSAPKATPEDVLDYYLSNCASTFQDKDVILMVVYYLEQDARVETIQISDIRSELDRRRIGRLSNVDATLANLVKPKAHQELELASQERPRIYRLTRLGRQRVIDLLKLSEPSIQ